MDFIIYYSLVRRYVQRFSSQYHICVRTIDKIPSRETLYISFDGNIQIINNEMIFFYYSVLYDIKMK